MHLDDLRKMIRAGRCEYALSGSFPTDADGEAACEAEVRRIAGVFLALEGRVAGLKPPMVDLTYHVGPPLPAKAAERPKEYKTRGTI